MGYDPTAEMFLALRIPFNKLTEEYQVKQPSKKGCDCEENVITHKYCSNCGKQNVFSHFVTKKQILPALQEEIGNEADGFEDDYEEFFSQCAPIAFLGYKINRHYSEWDGSDDSWYVTLPHHTNFLRLNKEKEKMKKIFQEIGLWDEEAFQFWTFLQG